MNPPTTPRATLPLRATMVSIAVLRGPQTAPEMLLIRRASPYLEGVWSYVAGHVEAGETGWQAALRELREETDLVPAAFFATSFCETIYMAATDSVEIVPAFVARVGMDAAVTLNRESSAYRWLSLAAAADAVPFGSQRQLIAYLEREFVARAPAAALRITLPTA